MYQILSSQEQLRLIISVDLVVALEEKCYRPLWTINICATVAEIQIFSLEQSDGLADWLYHSHSYAYTAKTPLLLNWWLPTNVFLHFRLILVSIGHKESLSVCPFVTCNSHASVLSLPSQDWLNTTSTASRMPSRRFLTFEWKFNKIVNSSVRGGGANWLWPMACSANTEDWWPGIRRPTVPELHLDPKEGLQSTRTLPSILSPQKQDVCQLQRGQTCFK